MSWVFRFSINPKKKIQNLPYFLFFFPSLFLKNQTDGKDFPRRKKKNNNNNSMWMKDFYIPQKFVGNECRNVWNWKEIRVWEKKTSRWPFCPTLLTESLVFSGLFGKINFEGNFKFYSFSGWVLQIAPNWNPTPLSGEKENYHSF